MKTKKWILLISILILLTVGYFLNRSIKVRNPDGQLKTSTNVSSHISVKQTINSAAQKKTAEKTVIIERGSTAVDLLKKTFNIQTKGEGANAFVISIDGMQADDSKKEFWAFYVNGKQAEVGAGSYILKENDAIEWKIETY